MADRESLEYYGALLASGISVLGWLVGVLAAGYTGYALLINEPIETPALVALFALAAGVWFARLEKSLYRPD